ncbi:MAG: ester cyclase [Solirubrobacteraceae bacterium]
MSADTVREYFEALAARDATAPQRFFAPDGVDNLHGLTGPMSAAQASAFFAEVFAAFPDFTFAVLEVVAQEDRAVVRWSAKGTFAGPGSFQGLKPNGARIDLEGADVLQVRDGKIVRNDAYLNGLDMLRQLGASPPAGSTAEHRLTALVNARQRLAAGIASKPEEIADGVWVMRGGFPGKTMNVYFVRDGDGVLLFDAGIEAMTNSVAAAGAALGGITRVVLGHSHADHRGVAPGLGAEVFCHPAERADAEGDGGLHYMDLSKLSWFARPLFPTLLRQWDGGPVPIAGTVNEGDEIAGFEVVHTPGHAPGLIALWRASDRLALASDTFYTLDPQTGRHGHPRVPHVAFNLDTEQARASVRKLADLRPAAAWAGHADPLTGDVHEQLQRAADTT